MLAIAILGKNLVFQQACLCYQKPSTTEQLQKYDVYKNHLIDVLFTRK